LISAQPPTIWILVLEEEKNIPHGHIDFFSNLALGRLLADAGHILFKCGADVWLNVT